MARLTGSQMKYLHVIFKAHKDNGGVRSVAIARELGVTKASVCSMVKLLTGLGLISMNNHGIITLTRDGKREGAIIHDKMTRIYSFFADFLELENDEALDNAYSFLSGFSDKCIERLAGKEWAMNEMAV